MVKSIYNFTIYNLCTIKLLKPPKLLSYSPPSWGSREGVCLILPVFYILNVQLVGVKAWLDALLPLFLVVAQRS